jgi:hypothetical protein
MPKGKDIFKGLWKNATDGKSNIISSAHYAKLSKTEKVDECFKLLKGQGYKIFKDDTEYTSVATLPTGLEFGGSLVLSGDEVTRLQQCIDAFIGKGYKVDLIAPSVTSVETEVVPTALLLEGISNSSSASTSSSSGASSSSGVSGEITIPSSSLVVAIIGGSGDTQADHAS